MADLKVKPTKTGAPGFADWLNDFVAKHNELVELVETKQDKRTPKTATAK